MASFLRRPLGQNDSRTDEPDPGATGARATRSARLADTRQTSGTTSSPGTDQRDGASARPGSTVPPVPQPDATRRVREITQRRMQEAASRNSVDNRTLTIGKEITLSGTITNCDVLIVEGTVEATLENSKKLEVTEAGVFRGTIAIDEATVAGLFEGDITVRQHLSVRPTGRLKGAVRCRKLEIDFGGEVDGEISILRDQEKDLPTAAE